MNQDTCKYYLRDLIYLIKENKASLVNDVSDSEFNNGVGYAYTQIVELIESQAIAFDIKLEDIGFNDYEKYQEKHK